MAVPSRVAPRQCRWPRPLPPLRLLQLQLLLWGAIPGARARGVRPSPVRDCCRGWHINLYFRASDIDPYWYYHPDQPSPRNFDGLLPMMLDAVLLEMGVTYTLVATDINRSKSEDLTRNLQPPQAGVFHGVGHYPQLAVEYKQLLESGILLSKAFYSSPQGALVHMTRTPRSFMAFVGPMSYELWIFFLLAVALLGLAVFCLRSVWPGSQELQEKRRSWQALAKACYEAAAICLGHEDWEHRMLTWPFRLLRLAALTFVIVFISTYTANLAAFFTIPQFQVHGPQSQGDLASATACTPLTEEDAYPNGTRRITPSPLGSFVKEIIAPPQQMVDVTGYTAVLNWCKEKLESGEADIMITEAYTAWNFRVSQENCKTLADRSVLVAAILPLYAWSSLAMGNHSREFLDKFDVAVLHFTEQPEYVHLLDETFHLKASCDIEMEASETTPVGLLDMVGLIIICASVVAVAFVLALILRRFYGSATARLRVEGSQRHREEVDEEVATIKETANETAKETAKEKGAKEKSAKEKTAKETAREDVASI